MKKNKTKRNTSTLTKSLGSIKTGTWIGTARGKALVTDMRVNSVSTNKQRAILLQDGVLIYQDVAKRFQLTEAPTPTSVKQVTKPIEKIKHGSIGSLGYIVTDCKTECDKLGKQVIVVGLDGVGNAIHYGHLTTTSSKL